MGKTILLLLIVIPLTFAVGFRTGQGDPGAYRNSLQSSPQTTTDSLVVDLHSAWNAADVEALVRRLDPDAFFFSPYQLRYGRDEMANTVLQRNPLIFRNVTNNESHSYVGDHLAWSIGSLRSERYVDGERLGAEDGADYLYVFTRNQEKQWKTQMMIYREACE